MFSRLFLLECRRQRDRWNDCTTIPLLWILACVDGKRGEMWKRLKRVISIAHFGDFDVYVESNLPEPDNQCISCINKGVQM